MTDLLLKKESEIDKVSSAYDEDCVRVVTSSGASRNIKKSAFLEGIKGKDGEDGISVVDISAEYALSLSETVAPTDGWSSQKPERFTGNYLWMRDCITFSDGHTTFSGVRCVFGDMLRLVIHSDNGNAFKNGCISTTLHATVYSWDQDVTEEYNDNQFIWTRISADAEMDQKWNAEHFGGAKSIVVTGDDVNVRATFCCDLIDTTSRTSLLNA